MKKLIIFTIFIFCVLGHSQENIQFVLKNISNPNFTTEISLKSNHFQKYCEVSKFINIDKNKVIEIYNNNRTTDFYLYHLNSWKEFSLYTLGHKDDKKMDINKETSNGSSDFILFDNKRNNILYIQLSNEGGAIYKSKKNIINIKYALSPMLLKIIKLDDRLMPISSISYLESPNHINNFELSFYEKNNNEYYRNIKYIYSKINNPFLMPLSDLYDLLDHKPISFDEKEKCKTSYCDSYISKIYFKN